MVSQPKCWACGHQLIWGGDHDYEDADDREYIQSNLSCPNCDAFYLYYQPIDCVIQPIDADSEGPEGS